jgi:hypothetical protein
MGAKIIFSNQTVSAIVDIVALLSDGKSAAETQEADEEKMEKAYNLHTANLPVTAREARPISSGGEVVLLTGSTGNLRSYILDSLISNSSIFHIYCLHRGPESA